MGTVQIRLWTSLKGREVWCSGPTRTPKKSFVTMYLSTSEAVSKAEPRFLGASRRSRGRRKKSK